MPLIVPQIDNRNYRDLLAEALARIPVHNPEWTNFNDSDPGVTLLQLFAFMGESLLYRSNLIPERNRIKFLQLLGVPLHPAAAAQSLITFNNERGPLETITLPEGLEVNAGQVPFRTTHGLDVLPLEAQVYYKRPLPEESAQPIRETYAELYASFLDAGTEPQIYETVPLPLPTSNATLPAVDLVTDAIDGSLWMALLARSEKLVAATREAIANKFLSLGVLPALTQSPRVLRAGGPVSDEGQIVLQYLIPDPPAGGMLPSAAALRVARYRKLDARAGVNVLEHPGVVELSLPGAEQLLLWQNLEPLEAGSGDFPPALEDTNVANRLVTWIRLKAPDNQANTATSSPVHARLSWVGLNAVPVSQRAHVPVEVVGRGAGEPDQIFRLANTPVITEPAGSVLIAVNGELWSPIDDLFAAGPEVPLQIAGAALQPEAQDPQPVKVFQVDRESGEIRFGDGRHGARPPFGALIEAQYDYGGGRTGMVGIGAINKSAVLPAGIKVHNPIPAYGGDEPETVAEAEKRIPQFLRHRERLVTAEDFRDLTFQAPGVDVGRVEVLPLFNPDLPGPSSPGVVTVMVIPLFDPLHLEAPEPDQLFLDTVCSYLAARRLVTTEVHVRGPVYSDLHAAIGLEVLRGLAFAPVREAVARRMREFLSPLLGGRDGQGWPLNKSVVALELLAEAARVSGVELVNGVRLADAAGTEGDSILMQGLQLPRLASITISLGQPDQPGIAPTIVIPANFFPVPVVPEVC